MIGWQFGKMRTAMLMVMVILAGWQVILRAGHDTFRQSVVYRQATLINGTGGLETACGPSTDVVSCPFVRSGCIADGKG